MPKPYAPAIVVQVEYPGHGSVESEGDWVPERPHAGVYPGAALRYRMV